MNETNERRSEWEAIHEFTSDKVAVQVSKRQAGKKTFYSMRPGQMGQDGKFHASISFFTKVEGGVELEDVERMGPAWEDALAACLKQAKEFILAELAKNPPPPQREERQGHRRNSNDREYSDNKKKGYRGPRQQGDVR
jgi:hypothetical protein